MIARMTTRRVLEKPLARSNPGGGKVYVARWRDKTGKRRVGYPPDIKGTHKLRRDAQEAIRLCHERDEEGPARMETVGGYAAEWLKLHPRTEVTNRTNQGRVNAVLDVVLDGAPLRDWPFEQLRRKHANELVGVLFTEQGRSYTGAMGVLSALSALTEDAIDDELALANPWRGVKVRRNDPRIRKQSKPVRVFSWPEMHAFARACATSGYGGEALNAWRAVYAEPMVRVLSDCGLRAGELLALERSDLDLREGTLRVERSVTLGKVQGGTKTTHGEVGEAAGRTVPVPPELLGMLRGMLAESMKSQTFWASALLFPSPRGTVWSYGCWWEQVWEPGREVAGSDMRPHECRHSYVSRLRAAGVDPADLADAAGHTVQTATTRYTHALRRSFDEIRKAVGE